MQNRPHLQAEDYQHPELTELLPPALRQARLQEYQESALQTVLNSTMRPDQGLPAEFLLVLQVQE